MSDYDKTKFPKVPNGAKIALDPDYSTGYIEYYEGARPTSVTLKNKESLVNDSKSGVKFDNGKVPLELLPALPLIKIGQVLEFGAKKYNDHNWRKGMKWSRVAGAALRHFLAWLNGEDTDPESGLSHLAHCACCLLFLLEYEKTKPELDDRWKNESK